MACLMALLAVTVWIPALLRDPINIAEFAACAGTEHLSDMAAYFEYETTSGAFLHLIVLGLVMGALLGIAAALYPLLTQHLRRTRPKTR